jgi:hypothetical protein
MKVCTIMGKDFIGKLEWHHVWIYASKQINEPWAIVSVSRAIHSQVPGNRAIRERLEAFSLTLATDSDLQKYPRKPWAQIMNYLSRYEPSLKGRLPKQKEL